MNYNLKKHKFSVTESDDVVLTFEHIEGDELTGVNSIFYCSESERSYLLKNDDTKIYLRCVSPVIRKKLQDKETLLVTETVDGCVVTEYTAKVVVGE